ncbi:hypothetical protein TNCV_567591 [Trichonephila clavipes]|nr:hypothetical protein TNCV_567591 [Trichonephila clavipes]
METNWWERSPNQCYYKQIDVTFYGNAIRANSHNVNEMGASCFGLCGLKHPSTDDGAETFGFAQKAKNKASVKFQSLVHNDTVNEFFSQEHLTKRVSEV